MNVGDGIKHTLRPAANRFRWLGGQARFQSHTRTKSDTPPGLHPAGISVHLSLFMAIRLYDSLTRELKVLGQREPGAPPVSKENPFTFYTCGPTVYAPAHIGNFRTFLVNDVLRRLLELEFGADSVRHVRNLTDVDDRTIGQAKREHRPLAEITRHWTEIFHRDCDALNMLRPHVEPTATSHIGEQVDMIEVLMRKGHAYRAQGHDHRRRR